MNTRFYEIALTVYVECEDGGQSFAEIEAAIGDPAQWMVRNAAVEIDASADGAAVEELTRDEFRRRTRIVPR